MSPRATTGRAGLVRPLRIRREHLDVPPERIDPGVLVGHREMPVRWRHTAEIRDRYGYRDFAAQPGRFAFTAWLYRQAWADEAAGDLGRALPPYEQTLTDRRGILGPDHRDTLTSANNLAAARKKRRE